MSVNVTQTSFNSKSKLEENKQKYGLKGKAIVESDTVVEVRELAGLGRKNLIINGDFRVWQRGTTFTINNKITADRWKFYRDVSGSATSTSDGLRLEKTLGTNSWSFIGQVMESIDTQHLNGKTITMSAKVKGETINKVRLYIGVEPGEDNSQALTAPDYLFTKIFDISTDEFTKISFTVTLPKLATDFTLGAAVDLRNTFATTDGDAVIIKDVQIEEGAQATDFEFRHIGAEIELCERFYQKSYDLDTVPYSITEIGTVIESGVRNDVNVTHGVSFLTTMRAIPTMVAYSGLSGNGGKIHNNGDKVGVVGNIGHKGFDRITITSGNAAVYAGYHYTADAEIY